MSLAPRRSGYFSNAFWADPLIDDAARWMRKLHDDPTLRLRLGAAAKTRIGKYQAEVWDRRWIYQLIGLWQAQNILSRAPGKLSAMTALPPQAPRNRLSNGNQHVSFAKQAMEPATFASPEAYAAAFRNEVDNMGKLVRAAGIQPQ